MKTKLIIYLAYSNLMASRSIDAITIQDIIDDAEISRSTFYRHFKDKYEIACWYYDDCVQQLKRKRQANTDLDIEFAIVRVITKNQSFFQKVFNVEGQDSFEEYIADYTYRYFLTELEKGRQKALSEPEKFALKIYCDGASATMKQWLNSTSRYKDDTLSHYFKQAKPAFFEEL